MTQQRRVPSAMLTANTRHFPNVVLMLGRRRGRRANIKTTLGKYLVSAGLTATRAGMNVTVYSLEYYVFLFPAYIRSKRLSRS